MGNEFRCHALRRIDYYNQQKERSILSPFLFWRRLTSVQQHQALEHIKTTADRCQPSKRNALYDRSVKTIIYG
jgi:hypothetical protein